MAGGLEPISTARKKRGKQRGEPRRLILAREELPFFIERVLPLLQQAALRQ
jgi:hypothetical protein